MPLTEKQLTRALALAQKTEDSFGARVRELLEKTRKDVIVEISSNPSQWRYSFLKEVLDQIDQRIYKLTIEFGRLTEEAVLSAITAGAGIGSLTISIDAPQSMLMINPDLLRVLADYRADLVTGLTDELRDELTELIRRNMLVGKSQLDTMKEIGSLVGPGPFKTAEYRGEVIMRTEFGRISNISNQASLEYSAKIDPRWKKRWVAQNRNTRRAHAEADGQIQPIKRPFLVGGEKLMFPLDPRGSAKNVVNCRCMSLPIYI